MKESLSFSLIFLLFALYSDFYSSRNDFFHHSSFDWFLIETQSLFFIRVSMAVKKEFEKL